WLPEPYSLRDVARWVRKAAAEGPQRFEWKDLDREGRTYWRDISLKKIVLNGVPRVMAITQDITERKRAEESLKRSESENRVLINALPDLLFRIAREGTIRDYRCSDASTLYVPPHVFLGKKSRMFSPRRSPAGRSSLWARCSRQASRERSSTNWTCTAKRDSTMTALYFWTRTKFCMSFATSPNASGRRRR
ncbi:MAG TPA: PAS domain S-box protein, partial [Nitrospirota bacterium]|nr:PAS domain S-box protein [Nitrospirota bacterium]